MIYCSPPQPTFLLCYNKKKKLYHVETILLKYLASRIYNLLLYYAQGKTISAERIMEKKLCNSPFQPGSLLALRSILWRPSHCWGVRCTQLLGYKPFLESTLLLSFWQINRSNWESHQNLHCQKAACNWGSAVKGIWVRQGRKQEEPLGSTLRRKNHHLEKCFTCLEIFWFLSAGWTLQLGWTRP